MDQVYAIGKAERRGLRTRTSLGEDAAWPRHPTLVAEYDWTAVPDVR